MNSVPITEKRQCGTKNSLGILVAEIGFDSMSNDSTVVLSVNINTVEFTYRLPRLGGEVVSNPQGGI